MELERFVRLEWPRTENESQFSFCQSHSDHRSQYQCAVLHLSEAQCALHFKPQHEYDMRAPQTFLSSDCAYAKVCKTPTW